MANLRGSMARAGKSDVFALGFSDKMKSVAGAMAVLALATTGTVVVQSQTAPAASAEEAAPADDNNVAPQADEAVAQEGEVAGADAAPDAGEAANDATTNEEVPAPAPGDATPPAAGAGEANGGDTAAQAEAKSQTVTFGVRINGVANKSGGSANPTQDLPESLHDVVVTLTSQADGTAYNSNDNGETWRGASGYSVVQNFGLKKLPAGTYNVSISGLDDISNDGLQVKPGSQLTNGGTVEITGSTGNLFIEFEYAPETVTQKVTFGVEIDGSFVRSGGSSGYDKNLPDSLKDVVVTLTGADGTQFNSNDNGETWRGTEGFPVGQNFGLQDIPAGNYTVSISGLDDISKDNLKVKENSQLTDGGTVEITGNTANLFIQLETVPEVKTQRVTFGVKIDGKIVESDGDNSTANELKESLRDVVVTLTAEDGTEYKSNDNGETWRGAKGSPVVQNFGLNDIPAGTYKVSITGLDDIDQDDLKVKDGSQLTDGGTVEITGNTGNLFIELETVDPADDKTSVDDSNVKPVDPTDEDQGTGIIVNNPDDDTKVSATDEDGKDVPATIDPETGEIIVTPGEDVDGPITVVVEDPDLPDGKVEIEVPVNGHEKDRDDNGDGNPADDKTSVDDSNVKPVDPTDEDQGTGIIVNNPDDDTKVSATDEDGKDVPATIDPETGEIIVTPGEDVDGPITVVVEDPDLPDGKVEIEVPVNGHEKDRDDNGNGNPKNPGTGGSSDLPEGLIPGLIGGGIIGGIIGNNLGSSHGSSTPGHGAGSGHGSADKGAGQGADKGAADKGAQGADKGAQQGGKGAGQSGTSQSGAQSAQSGASSSSAGRQGSLAVTGVSGVAIMLGAAAMALAIGGALLAGRRRREN